METQLRKEDQRAITQDEIYGIDAQIYRLVIRKRVADKTNDKALGDSIVTQLEQLEAKRMEYENILKEIV